MVVLIMVSALVGGIIGYTGAELRHKLPTCVSTMPVDEEGEPYRPGIYEEEEWK